MSKNKITIPPEKLALYDKLIASQPDMERKGATVPYTSLNGHMFTFLSKEGVLGIRLSKDDREAFLQKFNTGLMEQHSTVMKEYVQVPAGLLADTETLTLYVRKSYDYIKTLKPKPTRKKAK